jgi:RNA polymerase sigma factor for flagellar operon FliA
MINVSVEQFQEAPRNRRKALRQQLIEKYTPLIKLVASRIIRRLPPQIEMNDLVNSGVLGLMDAIEKYDPSREIKFETYAEFRIRGSILDELRSQDWVPRSIRQRIHELDRAYEELEAEHNRPATDEEVSERLGITLEELFDLLNKASGVSLISLEDLGFTGSNGQKRNLLEYFKEPRQENVLDFLEMKELKKIVAGAIKDLPKNERFVVSMYYYDELTMKEIGLVLGITESRVSQIHNKAMIRLRGKINRTMRK